MAKVSKASVRYRPADLPEVRCGTCIMFHPDGTCDLVAGKILSDQVCDRWEPRHRIPSGAARQAIATAIGAAVAAVFAAAEGAILAAAAQWILKVLTGGLLVNLAARRFRQTVTLILHQAQISARDILSSVAKDVRRDAERVIRQDLATVSPQLAARAAAEALGGLTAAEWRNLPTQLHQAGLNALRETDDIFRQAVAEAMAAEPDDRLDAAQRALDGFAERGITAFTDTLGRRWDLSAYVEMATRTAASRMHLALQLAAMQAAGLELVLIVHTGDTAPCPRCAPYVGQVMSLGGLAEARAHGLYHPNCRCSAVPWTEGMGIPSSASLPPDYEELYEAEQRQRARQRRLRRSQRQRAAAMTRRGRGRVPRVLQGPGTSSLTGNQGASQIGSGRRAGLKAHTRTSHP